MAWKFHTAILAALSIMIMSCSPDGPSSARGQDIPDDPVKPTDPVTPEEPDKPFSLADFKVIVNASVTVSDMLPGDSAWKEGDEIYLCIDGRSDDVYKLRYYRGTFVISQIDSTVNAGFKASGTVTAVHADSFNVNMKGGTLNGSTSGDILTSSKGTYSKDGTTVTITIPFDARPVSIIKITGILRDSFIRNVKTDYTRLVSLKDLKWDESTTTYSAVFDRTERALYCYGIFPDDGRIILKYPSDQDIAYRRKSEYAVRNLQPGKMLTVSSPAEAPDEWEIIYDFDHYDAGDKIIYCKSSKDKPVNIVVTGDGFNVYDQRKGGTFEKYARYAMDRFFSVEPYKSCKEYFNVIIAPAVSKERGADISSLSQVRDTYFDTGWTSGSYGGYNSMISSNGQSRLYAFLDDVLKISPNRTFVLVLCNEVTYGAVCCWNSDPPAGFVSLVLNGEKGAPKTMSWSGNWDLATTKRSQGDFSNLVLHEIGGHAVGQLDDEYPSIQYSQTEVWYNQLRGFGKNLSRSQTDTPWNDFKTAVNASGKYPSGNAGLGEYLCNNGVYRSDYQGCMSDNRLVWGVWNRYLIAKRIHDLAGESYSFSDFISQVPSAVNDPTWLTTRSQEVEIDGSAVYEAPPDAPPAGKNQNRLKTEQSYPFAEMKYSRPLSRSGSSTPK